MYNSDILTRMVIVLLLLFIIFMLYNLKENLMRSNEGLIGEICFGNCGCETERMTSTYKASAMEHMCAFRSDNSRVPQICGSCSGEGCNQCGFLESMMLKCTPNEEPCVNCMNPQLEDQYGFPLPKCGLCSNQDFLSSPEPKESYPLLPPIAPEVLPVGYFMPTALQYDRVEPPRNFSSAPPLDALRYSGGEHFGALRGERSEYLENPKPTVTLYKTEWCGYCQKMKPVFDRVMKNADATGIIFKIVDCDQTNVSFVKSYPTIIYTDTAGKSTKYIGPADYQKLLTFVLSPVH